MSFNTALGLANALQIAHPDFDLSSLSVVMSDMAHTLEAGLPYTQPAAGEGESAVDRERQVFVDRFKAMNQRIHKDTEDEESVPKPVIKVVGKKDG